MTPYVQMLAGRMRPEAQGAFSYDYSRFAKDPAVAFALTLVFGIVGGESYYVGDYKRGILMTLGLLSGIGLFITVPMWITRCCTIVGECEAYNDHLAYALAWQYGAADGPAPQPPAPSARPTIGGLPMRAPAR